MKKDIVKKILPIMIVFLVAYLMTVGCGKSTTSEVTFEESKEMLSSNENIVVGFSQLGAESDWRSANTESMKETFTEANGYTLLIEDGQQKQANQIMAIRTFIQQEVDYIVLAPVTETGWDTVLQEAKDAGIPVIIVDRMVDVEDDSLFTCWVGSDFQLEGEKVTTWLNEYTLAKHIAPEDIHIVNIQGSLGSSAQIGRTKGLTQAARLNGWDFLEARSGDFTQEKGKEVMEYFLKRYDNVNVVYCENDNEALGAIQAIEAAGKKVGSNINKGEIMVVSFDGVKKEAIEDVLLGKISCIAECNPWHGPRVQAIIELLQQNKMPAKFSYVNEGMYTHDETINRITVDHIEYPVTVVTEKVISEREY